MGSRICVLFFRRVLRREIVLDVFFERSKVMKSLFCLTILGLVLVMWAGAMGAISWEREYYPSYGTNGVSDGTGHGDDIWLPFRLLMI